jgi:hypothetical protein
MKIYTSVTYQMTDVIGEYIKVSETSFNYEGTVGLCKGDNTAKKAEQQQQEFDAKLMDIFQAQYGKQSQVFDFLKSKMSPMIDNPTGMSPDALAATRTSVTDADSVAFQNAQRALNAKMAASGESTLPSGVGAQLNEALLNQEAAQKSADQNTVTMQNEQLKQSNYWNAVNALNGVGAEYNPNAYASNATAGTSAVANASQAVTAAAGPGWGQILGGVAGGVLGAAGKAASGGATGGLSAIFGCWIAAAIWGVLDPRTWLVRSYIHGKFAESWYGAIISKTYMKHGDWVSQQPILVKMLTPFFYLALNSARKAA